MKLKLAQIAVLACILAWQTSVLYVVLLFVVCFVTIKCVEYFD